MLIIEKAGYNRNSVNGDLSVDASAEPKGSHPAQFSTKKAPIRRCLFCGGKGGFLPLNKGKANIVCEGNSLKKGNVAKRQKDGCPAKDCRRGERANL